MAIEITGAGYIYASWASVPSPPFTMSIWLYSTSASAAHLAMSMFDYDASSYHYLESNGALGSDPFVCGTRDSSTVFASTSTGYTVNTWHHICGVFSAANSRTIYIDAGSSGTNTASKSPSGLDSVAFGGIRLGGAWQSYSTRRIAEGAVWGAAISQEEIASLARGFRPSIIRPQSLLIYAPLLRDVVELKSGLSLSTSGTSVVPHPRRIG